MPGGIVMQIFPPWRNHKYCQQHSLTPSPFGKSIKTIHNNCQQQQKQQQDY